MGGVVHRPCVGTVDGPGDTDVPVAEGVFHSPHILS